MKIKIFFILFNVFMMIYSVYMATMNHDAYYMSQANFYLIATMLWFFDKD